MVVSPLLLCREGLAASLCRDLDQLAHHGYETRRLQPFDMFPQTEQVETVALLER